ncbi:MAG: trypsin-like serine protease [Elusimicrobia bacterium]|nr:trypsin-like serine protease [Elusimicrobiota bacterium]
MKALALAALVLVSAAAHASLPARFDERLELPNVLRLHPESNPGEMGGSLDDVLYGGQEIAPGDPLRLHAARLVTWDAEGDPHGCSAFLVAPDAALTAAHCVRTRGKGELRIHAGKGEPLRLEIAKIIPHPRFRDAKSVQPYDIAVLRLAKKAPFALPFTIDLPGRGDVDLRGAFVLTGSGGPTKSRKPQVLHLDAARDKGRVAIVNRASGSDKLEFTGFVKGNTCPGDSGGATLQRKGAGFYLVSVHSGGRSCGAKGGGRFVQEFVPTQLEFLRSALK